MIEKNSIEWWLSRIKDPKIRAAALHYREIIPLNKDHKGLSYRKSFANALDGAFFWEKTTEGYDYWLNITKQYSDADLFSEEEMISEIKESWQVGDKLTAEWLNSNKVYLNTINCENSYKGVGFFNDRIVNKVYDNGFADISGSAYYLSPKKDYNFKNEVAKPSTFTNIRKVGDLKDNECIHCETKEEALAISRLMFEDKTLMVPYGEIGVDDDGIVYFPKTKTCSNLKYTNKIEYFCIYKAKEFLINILNQKQIINNESEGHKISSTNSLRIREGQRPKGYNIISKQKLSSITSRPIVYSRITSYS